MSDPIWQLGATYRDTASKERPEDQFLRWFRVESDRSIDNSAGIRSLRFEASVTAPHPHACVVLVTSDLGSLRAMQWVDAQPDYQQGLATYWGDAQVSRPGDPMSWRGNKILSEVMAGNGASPPLPTPILLFAKPRSGEMRFRGLGVLRSLKQTMQHQAGGQPVENLLAEIVLLDCREIDAAWITARADHGPAATDSLAPAAWKLLLAGRTQRLALTPEETKVLNLASFPKTTTEAFWLLSPEDVVNAITRFDAGEKGDFEDSRKYDLIYQGRPYPPKAIAGMACKRVLGRDGQASEFSGGERSSSFVALQRLGFKIETREADDVTTDGILLTWNRQRWPWTDLSTHIQQIRTQGDFPAEGDTTEKERWSVGNRRDIPVGTRFFLIKLGDEPKGIFGAGWTTSEVYGDTHFDPAKAAAGENARYVRLRWEQLVDPLQEGCLPVDTFAEPELRQMHWSSQQSGITIPAAARGLLEAKWLDFLQSKGLAGSKPMAITTSPYTMADATADLFLDPSEIAEITDTLRDLKNVVLQGPPGVGKTFLARRLAYLLLGEKDRTRVEMVQFHQAYAYEDFVQGYRPTEGGFHRADGIFYRFCKQAAKDLGRPYVFIIDEVNRGNLAAIFGEVMMLIENDKRGPDFAIPLTYVSEADQRDRDRYRFYVPENLHLLGLMNTADRSLAMVDYALRRRFRFFSLRPLFNDRLRTLLATAGCPDALVTRLFQRITELNAEISEDSQNLGSGYQIGHSFFCPAPNQIPNDQWYADVIRHSVVPLLEEYWFDDPDRVQELSTRLLS